MREAAQVMTFSMWYHGMVPSHNVRMAVQYRAGALSRPAILERGT